MTEQKNTCSKIITCLEFVDKRLETTSEQTIEIAETIINDIKILTSNYQTALQKNELEDYATLIRDTQLGWINRLHDIIIEQANRDLNGQVIQSLKSFSQSNEQQINNIEFNLPSIVAREEDNQFIYLNQEEIELLMSTNEF